MRLTDFCLLFAALFICFFLGRDLKIQVLLDKEVSQTIYNRTMDRIAEDALFDTVETEHANGTLQVRLLQMQKSYADLLRLNFQLTDDDCRLRAWETVTLWEFAQYPYACSAQELDALREGFEQQINEVKRSRREQARLALEFPYLSMDDWYQMPAGAQLLTVFDARDSWWEMERAVFSGSRLIKLKERFARVS